MHQLTFRLQEASQTYSRGPSDINRVAVIFTAQRCGRLLQDKFFGAQSGDVNDDELCQQMQSLYLSDTIQHMYTEKGHEPSNVLMRKFGKDPCHCIE